MNYKDECKECKKLKKELTRLTEDIIVFLEILDGVYKTSSSVDRGKKVAELANVLEFRNDNVRHFVLDLPIDDKTKGQICQKFKKKQGK